MSSPLPLTFYYRWDTLDPARRAAAGTTAFALTKSVTLRPIRRRRLGSLLNES